MKDVKALITLRSGKKIEKPTPKPHVEKEEEIKKGEEMEDKESEISEKKKDYDSTMNAIPEKELLKEEMLKKSTSPPFPQALHGKKGIRNASEILEVLRQVKVNIPLLDMIKQVPTYAKFLKDLLQRSGSPTISVMIGGKVVEKALLDLGASVNLLPYSVYKQLGLDFIVLDTDPTVKEANLVPIILGRPFLATSNAIINCRNGLMQLTFGNMTLDLNISICLKSKPLRKKKRVQKSHQEKFLLEVLKRCKKAIGWQISDLKGISPLVCTHHIYMEEEAKPIRQLQRRLNPHLQEVVRAEVLKLLQAGIIYPISDSPWVSPTQVVPKKSGITVVQNEKGKKLLHASLQVGGAGESLWPSVLLFLDGYSGYFQIEIDVEDQEKPLYMSIWNICLQKNAFGLCNAPATFQRCMLSIFSDMVERIMEVFMDDITVYGGTFEECLVNLEAVLHRCIEKDLVLNWEKCHFMVRQGIVLGHIISEKGIEVDKAKVELIVKLPSPTTVKGVRQFLGHAGFYRRFIKGAVLGQREDGKPYVIYYASKTLNEAQRNYTTTEKELLAVVFALDKFRAYLVGSFIIVFTDHSALKYLLTKQDAKARLIRWILLLQEFDLQIKDKKGVENVVADHLSRSDHKKCVPEDEQQGILNHCHENACGGHFASQKTAMKVLQSGFTWPSLFKDAHIMCRSCDRCQRLGKQNDHRVVLKFLKENIFSRFGVPKAIISDGEQLIKLFLACLPIVLSMAKHVNLPVEVEYKAWWAIKKLNMDLIRRMKKWHDQLISNKEFQKGQRVLLYDTRLHIFPGKLKSRWIGPFIIHQVYVNGVVELLNSNGKDTFRVNGYLLKSFMEPFKPEKEEINLLEHKKPKQ
ncbi:Retrovirus-related Pol polyprotein from transposon 412 [Vitis vinifera]|uniref:RNA-directed DNA polymerase n=1 Tax=Vitis vinifera TaxID=29760 RepID=A0A438DZD8_VITVI|nr:Retrovirus-related Pol polyprotein from transposon 412 [Vitis vinifera]